MPAGSPAMTQEPITDATGSIEFFEPGKSPATKVEDRTPKDGLGLVVTFDAD